MDRLSTSKRPVTWSLIASIVFILLFAIPYISLFSKIQWSFNLDWSDFFWTLKSAFVQSSCSTSVSLILGLTMAPFLLSVSRKWRRSLEVMLMLPAFLPALYSLLALMAWVNPFPIGLVGVVLVHSYINAGLIAVLVARVVQSRVANLIDLALIEGARSFRIYYEVYRMLSREILSIAISVFGFCFTSFAVPLVVGMGKTSTIEVLIFERLKIAGDWSQALSLSFAQICIFILLGFLIKPQRSMRLKEVKVPSLMLSNLLAIGYIVFYLSSFFLGLSEGFDQIRSIEKNLNIFEVVRMSLIIGFSVGIFSCLVLSLSALAWFEPFFRRTLKLLVVPGSALFAFSFLVLFSGVGVYGAVFKLIVALTLLFVPILSRMGWYSDLTSLEEQIAVAKTIGASSMQIYSQVVLPQLMPRILFFSGIASFWAVGDFAVSKVILAQGLTLALVVQSLMGFFRLPAALLLSLLLVFVGCFVMFIFWGAAHVYGQKLKN